MRRCSPCPQCGADVPDSDFYCSQCGAKQPDEPLLANYMISFESITANAGHFGHSVEYLHDSRTVKTESWGRDRHVETLPVPDSVQTKRELNAFLDGSSIHR